MHPTLRSIANAFRSVFGYPPLIQLHKLNASWTVEAADELTSLHGLDLESDLVKVLSEEMRKEIDVEVLHAIYMVSGALQRINFRYNRGGTYEMNHRIKRSRFNKLNGTRNHGFKPRPTRYLVY